METASSSLAPTSTNQGTDDTIIKVEALPPPVPPSRPYNVCFCPSRWLMAYHDSMADISTFKSHLCLVNTNHDGDYNLALIDIKFHSDNRLKDSSATSGVSYEPPYKCYLKVYQGKEQVYCQRLYNFDVPSSLNVTATKKYRVSAKLSMTFNSDIVCFDQFKPHRNISLTYDEGYGIDSPTHLNSEHHTDKISKLEYEAWEMVRKDLVDIDTLYELLSSFKRQTSSSVELTSNSINFLALDSNCDRLDYIKKWRLYCNLNKTTINHDTICCTSVFKENDLYDLDYQQSCRSHLVLGTEDGHVIVYDINNESYCEHFRVPSSPNIILSDWRIKEDKSIEYKLVISCRNSKLYQIVYLDREWHSRKTTRFDIATNNKDSKGTVTSLQLASQHENGTKQQQMEKFHVERRSEQAMTTDLNLSIASDSTNSSKSIKVTTNYQNIDDATAGNSNSTAAAAAAAATTTRLSNVEILVHLNSFALDLSWFGHNDNKYLAVACVDRRCYCYSQSGCYLWSIREETPITCLESICNFSMSINLLAVASQSNRINFYEINGRIVDTIYLGKQDYATVLRFGRYGREDNCLCIVTRLGHLRIFILKRMAKFADGQCVTSALLAEQQHKQHQQLEQSCSDNAPAAAAAGNDDDGDDVATNKQSADSGIVTNPPTERQQSNKAASHANDASMLDDATNGKRIMMQIMSMAATNQHQQQQQQQQPSQHDARDSNNLKTVDQSLDYATSGGHIIGETLRAPLKIPAKPRSFVDQLTEQADCSLDIHRRFCKQLRAFKHHMIRGIIQSDPSLASSTSSRISLMKLKGLGPIYKLTLSIRLELCHLLRMDFAANSNPADNQHQQQQQQQQQVNAEGAHVSAASITSSAQLNDSVNDNNNNADCAIEDAHQRTGQLLPTATPACDNSLSREILFNLNNKRRSDREQTIGSRPPLAEPNSTTSDQQQQQPQQQQQQPQQQQLQQQRWPDEGQTANERYDIMLLLFASNNHFKLVPRSFKLGNLQQYQLEIDSGARHTSVLTSTVSLRLEVSSQQSVRQSQWQSIKVYATVSAYRVPLHMCNIELPLSETSF